MAISKFNLPSVLLVMIYSIFQGFSETQNGTFVSAEKGLLRDRPYRRQAVGSSYNSTRNSNNISDIINTVVFGFKVEKEELRYVAETHMSSATVTIIAGNHVTLRFFGTHFSPTTRISFTRTPDHCGEALSKAYGPSNDSMGERTALFEVNLDSPANGGFEETLYLCVNRQTFPDSSIFTSWVHQGNDPWLRLTVQKQPLPYLLPLWLQVTCIIVLLLLSGLFSGLNLGLMTLDPTELKIVLNCGSPKERAYAKSIMPLRKKGNFLLCTLLLGNVLVNSTLTILMDDMTSGLVAVMASTMGIVIFGEIIPQALCSRHGMAVGAKTIWLTKLFMLLTFPLSYPISRLLDCILGVEIGHVYNRERLMELIKVTHGYNDLEQEEVNIISGALELKKKTVAQIMTPLNDVFMMPYDAVLNFDTVSEIMRQGFTRVPVYDGGRTNVVALLNIKDLALVDPDDNTPVKTLCKFYNHHVRTVFDDTTLDVMLDEFKKGRSHMAFVQRVTTETEMDPWYETIGVVTLEDVIEEIIQSEIEDEMDTTADNRRRLRRRDAALGNQDVLVFSASGPQYQSLITPQLQLATFQFLSTSLEPFKEELIAPTILRRLLRHPESARFLRVKLDETDPPCLYNAGRPADYFVLILEGRIEVKVGSESLLFQSGPFTYFGISVLSFSGEGTPLVQTPVAPEKSIHQHMENFIPDFTVYPVTDLLYLYITRAQYVASFRASIVERGKTDGNREDTDKSLQQAKRQSIAALVDHANVPLPQVLQKSLVTNSNVNLSDIHVTAGEVIRAASNVNPAVPRKIDLNGKILDGFGEPVKNGPSDQIELSDI